LMIYNYKRYFSMKEERALKIIKNNWIVKLLNLYVWYYIKIIYNKKARLFIYLFNRIIIFLLLEINKIKIMFKLIIIFYLELIYF
jgi:hypothetical protein